MNISHADLSLHAHLYPYPFTQAHTSVGILAQAFRLSWCGRWILPDRKTSSSGDKMAASGSILVLLSGQPTPQPDELNTIRCRCTVGCRRRCPVGRLRACMACSTSVGPCCGFLAVDDSLEVGCPLRDFLVCHVCFSTLSCSPCIWSSSLSDFPRMNIQQAAVWHQARRDLVWRDAVDCCNSSSIMST